MDEVERFAFAFDYYFRHFYAQPFPRDLMMHNLRNSIDSLFRRAKQLKTTKSQTPKRLG